MKYAVLEQGREPTLEDREGDHGIAAATAARR